MDQYSSLNVGLRIRKVREELHLTREQFAEGCDLSPSFLADVERGKKGLSIASLYRICKFLCVSADYIVFGEEKIERKIS